MYIQSHQIAAWEREDLRAWLTRAFPEHMLGRSDADIAAYLDSRIAQARALRFTTPSHLRVLIGYELGCGIRWMQEMGTAGEQEGVCSPLACEVLRQEQAEPDARIAAVERLLYGRSR